MAHRGLTIEEISKLNRKQLTTKIREVEGQRRHWKDEDARKKFLKDMRARQKDLFLKGKREAGQPKT